MGGSPHDSRARNLDLLPRRLVAGLPEPALEELPACGLVTVDVTAQKDAGATGPDLSDPDVAAVDRLADCKRSKRASECECECATECTGRHESMRARCCQRCTCNHPVL